MIVEQTFLHSTKDGSNKVYIIEWEIINRYHNVNFAYGKKDAKLKNGRKCQLVSEALVHHYYNNLIQEKVNKGYKIIKVIKNPDISILDSKFAYSLKKDETSLIENKKEIKSYKKINITDEL